MKTHSKTITSYEYYETIVETVVEKFRNKDTIKDDEDTRECIEAMLWLMSRYRLKCLISTIIDIDDIWEQVDKTLEADSIKLIE